MTRHAERFMPRDAMRAVIEDARQSDNVASVVAREHFKSADLRTRYRLAALGESWKIVGIDHECLLCQGTGQCRGSRCHKCGGDGWYEPDRDAV